MCLYVALQRERFEGSSRSRGPREQGQSRFEVAGALLEWLSHDPLRDAADSACISCGGYVQERAKDPGLGVLPRQPSLRWLRVSLRQLFTL